MNTVPPEEHSTAQRRLDSYTHTLCFTLTSTSFFFLFLFFCLECVCVLVWQNACCNSSIDADLFDNVGGYLLKFWICHPTVWRNSPLSAAWVLRINIDSDRPILNVVKANTSLFLFLFPACSLALNFEVRVRVRYVYSTQICTFLHINLCSSECAGYITFTIPLIIQWILSRN